MKIYQLLETNRRPHLIAPSREYLYVQEHEAELNMLPDLLPFLSIKDDFQIIQMNIVIDSILSYKRLNEHWTLSRKKKEENPLVPQFSFQNINIYCPLFSLASNLLISKGLGENLSVPLDVVDFFELYNFALYESNYTSLVVVGGDKHSRAYYHYDFHAIYVVNDQGRLDVKICLFDKNILKPDFRNILERIKPVIEAYYNVDRLAFVKALYTNKLISNKLYTQYMNFLNRKRII